MDAERPPVPFVDLSPTNGEVEREVFEAWQRIYRASAFIGGEELERFEAELAASLGVARALGVANGTEALRLAYAALGVGPGDEVVTAAHTFIATAAAASQTGARPVLVDVDRETGTMDPTLLERAITPRAKVIAPVHLYGQPADLDPILEVADRHGLPVVEDTAQAQGAEYRGVPVGRFGALATLSFYPGKNLGACGDAGAVVTDDPDLARAVALGRDHGQSVKYVHDVVGSNARLDALQAAVLRIKLAHLPRWNDERRAIAARYAELLADSGLELPVEAPGRRHVWHLYVVRHARRDEIRELLGAAGVATGLHYPTPLHLQPAYACLGYREGDFPEAERWAREGLSLPIFPGMTEDQIGRVCDAIRSLRLEPHDHRQEA